MVKRNLHTIYSIADIAMTNAPCKFTSCKWIWIKQNVKQNVKQRPTRTNETKTKTQQTVVRNRNNQIVANDVNCFYYVSQFHTLSTQSVHTNQRIHMNKFYAVFVPIFVYFPFFLTLFSFLCFAFFISHFLVTFYFIIISLIHFVSWLLAAAIWLIYFVILCRLHINPFQQQNAFGQSFANIWCRTHTHKNGAHKTWSQTSHWLLFSCRKKIANGFQMCKRSDDSWEATFVLVHMPQLFFCCCWYIILSECRPTIKQIPILSEWPIDAKANENERN